MHTGERFKSGLKRAVRRVAAARGRQAGPHSLVLTYHSVGRRDHEMNVKPEAFREQMAWLADNTNVVPLREAVHGQGGVALTFDDGYRDNLTEAAPVLDALSLPATVFMVAGRAGTFSDHDSPGDASRLMTWDELRDLVKRGWTVGGHTMTHPRLSALNEPQQREEIAGSKTVLESELGEPVESFAYPFGSALDYTATSKALVQEAGYAFAMSNRYGVIRPGADRWSLRRIWIDRSDTLTSFRAKVEGRLDNLAWLDSPMGIRARRFVNGMLKAG